MASRVYSISHRNMSDSEGNIVIDGRQSAPLPVRQLRYFSLVTELTVTELTTDMQNTRTVALLQPHIIAQAIFSNQTRSKLAPKEHIFLKFTNAFVNTVTELTWTNIRKYHTTG